MVKLRVVAEVGGGVSEVPTVARPCRVEACVAREAWDRAR